MADAISNNGVEIGGLNAGMVASEQAPLLAVFDMPFNFESWEAEKAAVNGRYGELIGEDLEKMNIKLVGWAKYGTADVYGNFPIKVPEDLKIKDPLSWTCNFTMVRRFRCSTSNNEFTRSFPSNGTKNDGWLCNRSIIRH